MKTDKVMTNPTLVTKTIAMGGVISDIVYNTDMIEPTRLKVSRYLAPTVAYDNCIIGNRGEAVELQFIQYADQNEKGEIEVNIVASVRLDGMDTLRQIRNQIDEHIRKEDTKEP